MRKQELMELKAGQVVLDTRNNVELEIVGVGETKVILINGKEYSKSTLKRYFKLVEQEIPEVVEPDNTVINDIDDADELTQEQDTQVVEPTITSDNTVDDEIQGEQVNTTKKHVVEPTIQQSNLIQSLNNLIDLHNVRLEPKREYIKVSMEGKRGALCMIRNSRYGSLHIDMKSKVFAQLTEEYRDLLIEQYGCRVYDKSRGYMRVFNCNDIEVLQTIILTAKQVG